MPKGKDVGKEKPPEWERFERAMRHILSVPKKEIERRDAEWRKERKERKEKSASTSPPESEPLPGSG